MFSPTMTVGCPMNGGAMNSPLVPANFHHTGVVVADLPSACAHVEAIYGIKMESFPAGRFHCFHRGTEMRPNTQIALSVNTFPHLELLQEVPDTVWTSTNGLHHVAYLVDDLPAASAELVALGLPIVVAGISGDISPFMATYHQDPLGPIVELLLRSRADEMAQHIAKSLTERST
jgi:methylmalonyl-CoA/ethylmalonyl-CoA epimerase